MARAGTPHVIVASAVTVGARRLAEFSVAGYLPKPFALETLVAAVERTLAHDEVDRQP
jgi:DNA-binding response OmpR family regulator